MRLSKSIRDFEFRRQKLIFGVESLLSIVSTKLETRVRGIRLQSCASGPTRRLTLFFAQWRLGLLGHRIEGLR